MPSIADEGDRNVVFMCKRGIMGDINTAGPHTREHVSRDKDIVLAASFASCMGPCLRLTKVVLGKSARCCESMGL